MAKTINRLSVKKVDNLKTSGWHPDGNGLYLQVSKSGSKSWVYRYQVNGKQKWHGLGSYTKENSLQSARSSALKCKQLRRDGIDPIEYKNQLKKSNKYLQESVDNFQELFDLAGEAIVIFDERGKAVWNSEPYENEWGGKNIFTGDLLPQDTYFYIFNKGDGSPKIKGFVYLIRKYEYD